MTILLHLNVETIRRLSPEALGGVVGGASQFFTCRCQVTAVVTCEGVTTC